MIITVCAFKGGVGKTTTAVHLAAYLQQKGPTLLVDGDLNRSAQGWARSGELPFKVVDERQAARFAREHEHIVIDTAARPSDEDLMALAGGCDLMVVPTTPDSLSLSALLLTVDTLEQIGSERFRVLLTIVPPRPSRDGEEARKLLKERCLPVFKGEVDRLVAFQKAALQGKPVYGISDRRAPKAWDEYLKIGKEIIR